MSVCHGTVLRAFCACFTNSLILCRINGAHRARCRALCRTCEALALFLTPHGLHSNHYGEYTHTLILTRSSSNPSAPVPPGRALKPKQRNKGNLSIHRDWLNCQKPKELDFQLARGMGLSPECTFPILASASMVHSLQLRGLE